MADINYQPLACLLTDQVEEIRRRYGLRQAGEANLAQGDMMFERPIHRTVFGASYAQMTADKQK